MSTGAASSLEGAYALSSGLLTGTTGIYYNQLYSTGAHFSSGQIYAPALPLINVYNNNILNNNLSGTNSLRVGYQHTGNFSVVMDIEYSGCIRPTTQKGMILLSTVATPSGLSSGFIVGITDTNRIYFNTSGYSKTLDKELGIRDFVYVSLAENRYVNIGIYSLNDNQLYKQSISLPTGQLNSQDIYIGHFLLANATDPYTGLYGKVNQVMLFHDTLTDSDVGICSNCSLTTGFNTDTTTYSFVASQITGMYFSGVMDWMITGYTNVTGTVALHNGNTLNIVSPSGMTGFVTTGQAAIPMFTGITVSGTRNTTLFLYDQVALNTFSTFMLFFDLQMTSGDTIEVYTYPSPNPNAGKRALNLNVPTDTGVIQMVCNSLNETSGVDYDVVHNEFSGFSPDDILSYDVVPSQPIVTAYSGYWSDGTSRITISGGNGYFPSTSQYLEDVGSYSGVVRITGLNGICTGNVYHPRFGYDLFINGQKLISGNMFNITASGTSGFVVWLSGNKLPPLVVYPLYDNTGGGPTGILAVDDNELAFIPQFSGFMQARIDVTGAGYAFGPFTGFGEQVWVNGLRGVLSIDYAKTLPCSEITGNVNPFPYTFTMYDSEADTNQALWNTKIAPIITGIAGFGYSYGISCSFYNPFNYPTNGICLEVWDRQEVSDGVFTTSWAYQGVIANNTYLNYTGWNNAGLTGTGIVMVRYNCNNIVGPFTMSTGLTIYTAA